MQWDLIEAKTILKTVPFAVEELHLRDRQKAGPKHPYHRLNCPDWVNILPITADGQAVLIRQSRAGSWRDELETPGGVVEPAEKDPTLTAARELEEETGYTSQRLLPLASINPNPAIQDNKLHMFLALNCVVNQHRQHFQDEGEDIRVELHPVADLEHMIRTGQINSCLCSLAIMLARKYLDQG